MRNKPFTKKEIEEIRDLLLETLSKQGVSCSISIAGGLKDPSFILGIQSNNKPLKKIPNSFREIPIKINYLSSLGNL